MFRIKLLLKFLNGLRYLYWIIFVTLVLIASEFGVELSQHRARCLESCSFEDADLLLPMESNKYQRLKELFPARSPKIRLLREFAPLPERILRNIDDPYGL